MRNAVLSARVEGRAMTPRERAHGEQRVLLVAEPEEADALIGSAPDLEIVVAAEMKHAVNHQ